MHHHLLVVLGAVGWRVLVVRHGTSRSSSEGHAPPARLPRGLQLEGRRVPQVLLLLHLRQVLLGRMQLVV